jgi:ankyrin repeat protein
MQLLLKRGADVDCRDNLDLTPPHRRTRSRVLEGYSSMQLLLEHGANPNERMRYGWTPLYRAVLNRMLKPYVYHSNTALSSTTRLSMA